MIRIAICDDDKKDRDMIYEMVSRALFDTEEAMIRQFENGDALLAELEKEPHSFDLLFLDICMNPVDGMEAADYIRKQKLDMDIIFITRSTEYVYRGYQYRAYSYIIKDRMKEDLPAEIQRYFDEVVTSEAYLNVAILGETHRIPISSIRYIDSNGRKLTLHKKDGEISFYSKMSEVEDALLPHGFLRIHQSYMVAKSEIRVLRKEEVVLDDIELPISRKYAETVREALEGSGK